MIVQANSQHKQLARRIMSKSEDREKIKIANCMSDTGDFDHRQRSINNNQCNLHVLLLVCMPTSFGCARF